MLLKIARASSNRNPVQILVEIRAREPIYKPPPEGRAVILPDKTRETRCPK